MKRVFTSPNAVEMEIVRGLIDDEGIETIELNGLFASIAGTVPLSVAMPELWVINDEDQGRAKAVVERMESGETVRSLRRESWNCPKCNETREGQFTTCWKCGAPRGEQSVTDQGPTSD